MAQNLDLRCVLPPAPLVVWEKHVSHPAQRSLNTISLTGDAPLELLMDAADKAEGTFLTLAETVSLKHPTASRCPDAHCTRRAL